MTDPAEAAQRAVSDPDPTPDPGSSTSSSTSAADESVDVLHRLVDGSLRGPSVDELCRDYNLDRGQAMVLRGVCRAGPGSGVPPVGDILLGILLMVTEWDDSSSQSVDEPGPNDVEPIAND